MRALRRAAPLRRRLLLLRTCGDGAAAARPELVVRDTERIAAVPGRLSVTARACELRDAPGSEQMLYWHMVTDGLTAAHGVPELSFVRTRDLLRPRDHTHSLRLLESISDMVDDGAELNEGTVVPVETHRRKEGDEEGPDAFLAFYPHPADDSRLSVLLLPPLLHRLSERTSTPLRATNLLFKHCLWHLLPPAVYRSVTPPAEDVVSASVIVSPPESCARVSDALGLTVTVAGGAVTVHVPRSQQQLLRVAEGAAEGMLLVASRHRSGVDAVLVWDPDRPMDSFTIGVRPSATNWNSDTPPAGMEVGATFVLLRPGDEPSVAMTEDGVVAVLSAADYRATAAALAAAEDCSRGAVAVRWVGDGGEGEGDWLEYVRRKVEAATEAKAERQQTPPPPSPRRGRRVDLDGVGGPQMSRVDSASVEPPAKVERRRCDPQLVRMELHSAETQPDRVTALAARVGTVIAAVCDHLGDELDPGGDEASISVSATDSGIAVQMLEGKAGSFGLSAAAVSELESRLRKHCTVPAGVAVTLVFRV